MPDDSRPVKRKARLDKIDWEELEQAPNMAGMLSYLKAPGGPEPDSSETAGSEPPKGESLPGDSPSRASLYPSEDSLAAGGHGGTAAAMVRETPIPETAPPSASALLTDPLYRETPTTYVPGVGKRRFHRCVSIEDAHTAGEQLLLETLYRLAQDPRWGRKEPDQSWLVSISMEELGRQVRLHRTNVRNNLNRLRDKLAIDLVALEDVHEQSARNYRLYPADQILARRKAAGMEWVVKNRSVAFVPERAVAEALQREMPGGGAAG